MDAAAVVELPVELGLLELLELLELEELEELPEEGLSCRPRKETWAA